MHNVFHRSGNENLFCTDNSGRVPSGFYKMDVHWISLCREFKIFDKKRFRQHSGIGSHQHFSALLCAITLICAPFSAFEVSRLYFRLTMFWRLRTRVFWLIMIFLLIFVHLSVFVHRLFSQTAMTFQITRRHTIRYQTMRQREMLIAACSRLINLRYSWFLVYNDQPFFAYEFIKKFDLTSVMVWRVEWKYTLLD